MFQLLVLQVPMFPVLPIQISLSVCLSQAPTPNVGLCHFSLASGEGKGDAARINQGLQLELLSLRHWAFYSDLFFQSGTISLPSIIFSPCFWHKDSPFVFQHGYSVHFWSSYQYFLKQFLHPKLGSNSQPWNQDSHALCSMTEPARHPLPTNIFNIRGHSMSSVTHFE